MNRLHAGLHVGDRNTLSMLFQNLWRNGRLGIGFNPKTQEKIKIPAKTVVKFRVAKAAKDVGLGVKK